MKRFVIAVLAAALCLTACMETEKILYRGSMFGTMQSRGVMLGDDGCVYHFTNFGDISSDFPIDGRVVAIFDVYSKIEGTERDYEAKVLDITVPLCKEPVICETEEEDAALGDDPIQMADGNWAGGYLNMVCNALVRPNSGVTHLVNLQIVPGENPDTLHTVLRHNAGEDKVTETILEDFSTYSFYASFPLADKIADGKTVVLEIKWFWDDKWYTVYANISK